MYDCIIVGSGPAGGSAAYHLAKRGRKVLILEKDALPRYKTCCGGVSPAIAKWFDFDFSPAISLKADTLLCSWKMGDPVESKLKTSEPVWMVRRDVFDHFLIQQAQLLGAELQDKTEVKGIKFDGEHWQVDTPQGSLTGRYLVAADGAKGPMAKWLGFKERKCRLAAALETEVYTDISNPSMGSPSIGNSTILHFEFGMVKNGYIWSFPKADGYSISVATFVGGEPKDLKKILYEYATKIGLDLGLNLGLNLSNCRQYEHPICLWDGEQQLHAQNAVLAGDAACIADPFTAEGIRPSIFTGIKAAEAIDKAIAGDTNALQNYSDVVNEEWGTEMAWAKKLAALFYRFPAIGYKVGVKRPTGPQLMGKILCGDVRYSKVANRAIKNLNPFGG
jgi:geranylgeranyl reductase family protein